MEWTVYNFECADAAASESFVDWLDATGPLDVPDDADAVHGPLVTEDGEDVPADVAWIAEYVYVMTAERVTGLLEDAAEHWERAVVASFDGASETCTEAVLYHSTDGVPVEQVRYVGVTGYNGQDMIYRFAMAHRFRFRAFAHEPPGPAFTDLFGTFEAVAGMGWGSDLIGDFERETGVAPTGEGLAFLEDDPVLDEGQYYEAADGE